MQKTGYSFQSKVKSIIVIILFISFFLLASTKVKADWVSDANARIEQIRKRDLKITVVDPNGTPASDISVQINQVRHRFAFGTCLSYGQLSSNSNYRNFVIDHFEWAVCENEMKWASNESNRDHENYNNADFIANWCASNNIILRGHNVVWETGAQTPSWLSGLACNTYPTPSAKLEEVDERINSIVGRYKDQIVQWDINNEMLSGNTFGCLGEAGRAHIFELANQIAPDCGMYMNEYSGNSFGSYDGDRYASRAQGLINLGAPVEGLGIQAHVASPFQPEKYYTNVLEELAVLNLPIIATEYDTDATSEYQRGEDLENFFRICFSHPNVEGIIMWGFLDGSCWRGNGIVNSNWTYNEAGNRYIKLLDEWTTQDSQFTDSMGNADFRGFHGTYEVTLSAPGRLDEVYEVELKPGDRSATYVIETNLNSAEPIRNLNNGNKYIFIQQAIDDADPCDIIMVAPGIYCEDIDFVGKNLTLSSLDPNDPEIVSSTIISGSDKAVTFSNGEKELSIITGFTITDANTGIYCKSTSPTISKCRITENLVCGIFLDGNPSPSISGCEILCNYGSGLAIATDRGSFLGAPAIKNTIIAANRLYGINCNVPTIDNCTIAANGEPGLFGKQPQVKNSIIFFNNGDNEQINSLYAALQYSDIQGGWAGTGNINQDPCFAETGFWDVNGTSEDISDDTWLAGDYHLLSEIGRFDPNTLSWVFDDVTSPCVDAGDPNVDCCQEAWPHGNIINMGAYGGTSQASMSLSNSGDIRDLNNDAMVTWDDVLQLSCKWNCNEAPLKEDLNLDCIVDVNDLAFFDGNWSEGSGNNPPVLYIIEDKYASTGELLEFSVDAVEIDGDELIYKAFDLPEGAVFTGQSFAWTPGQTGTFFVTFIVSDYKSLDYKTVKIVVSEPQLF